MVNIQKYTGWLQVISIAFAIFMFGEISIKWFFGSFLFRELYHMSFIQRLLGFVVDGIALAIICVGIFAFNQLMKKLKTGNFFTSDIVQLLSTLSKFALSWALYNPLRTTLLSIITTLYKGPGNRIISVEFGLKDMINIFIFVCIILIAALIQEGLKLKREQDLTI